MSATHQAALEALTSYQGTALNLLHDTLENRRAECWSFLKMLESANTREEVAKDKSVFSDIISYAINSGLVDQATLAEETRYEKSQIGRWKNGHAAPPERTRLAVLDDLTAVVRAYCTQLQNAYAENASA
jgi:hypothetical protein